MERHDSIEMNVGKWVNAVVFSTNGEHLFSGGNGGVTVLRVKDKKQVTMLKAKDPHCLAVSRDGRFVATGTWLGDVFVWDANTYKQVLHQKDDALGIHDVDFSPDATRLVAASDNGTVSIWSTVTRTRLRALQHDDKVFATKYSTQGDRIAAATQGSVRVYDSSDGRLLLDINISVTPQRNTGLLWSNDHLLVVSESKIKQIEVYTGSVVSEWLVPTGEKYSSCIAQPMHGEFIVYSSCCTVTFWNNASHTQLGIINYPQSIRSVALSPDDRFLAIGGEHAKITIVCLSRFNSPTFLPHPYPTFQEPDIHLDDAVLHLWKQDRLVDTEALLTAKICICSGSCNRLFVARALVRTRLRKWDAALTDAEKAIGVESSIFAYIAKSIALVGKGERHKGYRTCDIAFKRLQPSHVSFLLLMKAITVFMAGEHHDAISRIDDLVTTAPDNSIYHVVQAYMHLLVGNFRMENSDYEGAIQSFGHARAKMQLHSSRALFIVSLISGWKFDNLNITIRQCLCEALYAANRTEDAVACFHGMTNKPGGDTELHGEVLEWAQTFKQRSFMRLEYLGDAAATVDRHSDAICLYTTALVLHPPFPQGILIKRGKAYLATESWMQALDDANQVIALDPSSPWGYEIKYAALHKTGDYSNAIHAFEAMLSKMDQSPDPDIRQYHGQYKSPAEIRNTIREIIDRTLRDSPQVLIDTTSGRLRDRVQRASEFESLPVFSELLSSMTTSIDHSRIKDEVEQYFEYVILSHKWEDNEPLFQDVIHLAVYDLDPCPTHEKLQMFCTVARSAGFKWAWSDTCCIDTGKHDIHQEALVAMFKWYRGAALMIVFLRGVRSASQLGALARSTWNTRGWTLQEYIAAKVIRFYTEDWTPYLNLEVTNHKEAPEVIMEMEQATGVSTQQLVRLRPGLSSIREKLHLASTRHTARVKDAAYSLLGIFSVTGISPIYGEGEAALGRLLSHILTGSGDVSILAWTGESGRFNSCLPAYITVFNGPATSHLPSPIIDAETERLVSALRMPQFDLDIALKLYDRLRELPVPSFAANRMKLPCIAFQLPRLSGSRTRSGRVYRADTVAFGTVEVKTRQDLSRTESLYLVHPWLDTLLEQEHGQGARAPMGMDVSRAPSPNGEDDMERVGDDDQELSDSDDDYYSVRSEPDLPSPARPVPMPADRETRARRLVARLGQPFGALLVSLASTGRRTPDYRRVAADSLITVQFRENVSLSEILDNVRTLDVL